MTLDPGSASIQPHADRHPSRAAGLPEFEEQVAEAVRVNMPDRWRVFLGSERLRVTVGRVFGTAGWQYVLATRPAIESHLL